MPPKASPLSSRSHWFDIVAILTILTGFIGISYSPLKLRADVLGVTRPLSSIKNIHGHELKIISGTRMCEDLHLHTGSAGPVLVTACEGEGNEARWEWFPGTGETSNPTAIGQGRFVVVDPQTFKATALAFTNFKGPFVTHGIDIIASPKDPSKLYIYAINHLPDPEETAVYTRAKSTNETVPKNTRAASQIEIFEHTLGTSTVTHLRSVKHSMITTPNDIRVTSPTTFYVSNDHLHRGGIMRLVEDIGWQSVAPWGSVVRVHINDLQASDPTADTFVTVALSDIHNPNGLGAGASSSEILIARAAAGVLNLAEELEERPGSKKLKIIESIQLNHIVDNPNYFSDPYVVQTGRDASGYVLTGLARGCDLGHTRNDPKGQDPVMVTLLRRTAADEAKSSASQEGESVNEKAGANIVEQKLKDAEDRWEKKLVFQDDGLTIRSAATSVLIAIDPAENQGRKQGWLFVTGFVSENMVAARIDL